MRFIIICFICLIMISSIVNFLMYKKSNHLKQKGQLNISFEVFYSLIIIYCIAIIGFGLIYFVLSFYEYALMENVIKEDYSILTSLAKAFYFSGLTIFTIGYGDIVPIGFARFVAIVQGMLGVVLPTIFLLKLVHLNLERTEDYY